MKLLTRLRPPRPAAWGIACAAVLAIGITSIATGATGSPVRIGQRNFAPGTTAIVGGTTGFATRQSNNNNGDGGAASYGCRAQTGNEPCLFVLNHNNGLMFRFQGTGGTNGGEIKISPPQGKTAKDVSPFTTNATGVATGLNADQVDGQSASEIIAAAQAAAQPQFAAVNANGTVAGSRGLAQSNAVTRTADGTYTVAFSKDISKCAYSATETTTTDAGAAAVAAVAGKTDTLQVVTRSGGGTAGTDPTLPADRPFHLVVNC